MVWYMANKMGYSNTNASMADQVWQDYLQTLAEQIICDAEVSVGGVVVGRQQKCPSCGRMVERDVVAGMVFGVDQPCWDCEHASQTN